MSSRRLSRRRAAGRARNPEGSTGELRSAMTTMPAVRIRGTNTACVRLLLSTLLLVCLLLACSAPLTFERARIHQGICVGGGLGVTSSCGFGEAEPDTVEEEHWGLNLVSRRDVSAIGSISLFCGLSPSLALGARASTAFWRHSGSHLFWPLGYLQAIDLRAGLRTRVGGAGAFALDVGWPTVAECGYLHDFGNPLTLRAGLGVRGLDAAGVLHVPLGLVDGHLVLSTLFLWPSWHEVRAEFRIPSFSLGLGIGSVAAPWSEDGWPD